MFRAECKKVFIKQYGIFLLALFLMGELMLLNYCYPVSRFQSPKSEQIYREYMETYSGELTPEKEQAILKEQERIIDAKNKQAQLERSMRNGEYDSEQAFLKEYTPVNEIVEREDAFELLLEKYTFAKEAPDARYILSGNYDGLTVDIPDVALLAVVIYIAAALFLGEEISNMIGFIRISQNGRGKTYANKILVLLTSILLCSIIRLALEFVFLLRSGRLSDLRFPVQSIKFYSSCPYNCSIITVFFFIQALRLVGTVWIASLVMLLSSFTKKALYTIFVPCALMVLQQFSFRNITQAYYLPSGLLRAAYYFKGNEYEINELGEEILSFARITGSSLLWILFSTLFFIIAAMWGTYRYYKNNRRSKPGKRITAVALMLVACGVLYGCSADSHDRIVYNLYENTSFAQNNTHFFISGNDTIKMISKTDKNEMQIVHRIFDTDGSSTLPNYLFLNSSYIYFMASEGINSIALKDYHQELFSGNSEQSEGFLGIALPEKADQFVEFHFPTGFFVIDGDLFQVNSNGVERNNKYIIDEAIKGLSCDGENIYFINSLYQLMCYHIADESTVQLPGEFVKCVYYDGSRILYSDKDGLFSLDNAAARPQKLLDANAEYLCSNGKVIVYQHDNALYVGGNKKPLYNEAFTDFAILSETDEVLVINNLEYTVIPIDNGGENER